MEAFEKDDDTAGGSIADTVAAGRAEALPIEGVARNWKRLEKVSRGGVGG